MEGFPLSVTDDEPMYAYSAMMVVVVTVFVPITVMRYDWPDTTPTWGRSVGL
jgi:hypothetical protein